jgi:hypothetical protein
VLGTVLIHRSQSTITDALTSAGVPHGRAAEVASSFGTSAAGGGTGARGASPALVHDVQLAFAHATQTVFYVMAAVLAVNLIVAALWPPRGRVETAEEDTETAAAPA